MYAELATVLRPGGLLLDGDHLTEDAAVAPTLARLDQALTRQISERGSQHGTEHGTGRGSGTTAPEDWQAWWQAATVDPALAGPAAERERRRLSEDHHGSESVLLARHVSALAAAGFSEIGIIWQHGESRILAAVLGR
jgi:hypothetical protein